MDSAKTTATERERQARMRHGRARLGAAMVAAVLSGAVPALGGDAALDGAGLYRRYCAACHGGSGRGDGPAAAIFVSAPRNLRDGFLKPYTTDDLVRRVREGRPLELALHLPSLQARAKDTEGIAAHLKRLPAVDWSLAGRGWDLYAARCEICHGAFGQPGHTLPPGVQRPRDLSDPAVQRSISDAELTRAVRHGRKGMPALAPRVPASDSPALVAFVRLLSPGMESYTRYCSNCHGDDGRGAGDLADGVHLPALAFDRAYFSHRSPEQIREAIWHMIDEQKPVMPHYRWALTEPQVRAVVEYLKGSD